MRLAVVAMGKCGARELNYASDIDVIFVAEPVPRPDGSPANEEAALKTATRLATGLIRACDQVTPEGSLFPVDPNLRPEGRQGTLVRTLGQPPGLLRPVGEDLGVPGAAQGAARGGRPGARQALRGRGRAAGLAGVRAGELRRGRAGDAPPGASTRCRRTWRAASSSSALAGCATSSSPSSCCSSCTAATDERLRVPATLPRARRPRRQRLRRPRRRRGPRPGVPVPAPDRAPAPALPAAPHPHAADRPGRAAPPRPRARHRHQTDDPERARGPPDGTLPSHPVRGRRAPRRPAGATARSRRRRRSPRRGRRPRSGCAGCTRSCSTGRCSTRWRSCRPSAARLTPEAARGPP